MRLCLAILLLSALCASAKVVYVDKAATGANNGTSWANAFTDFMAVDRSAGNVAAGDTVCIKGGQDYPTTYNQSLNYQEGTSGNWTTYVFTNGVATNYCINRVRNYTHINGLANQSLASAIGKNTFLTYQVTNNCNLCVNRYTNYYNSGSGGHVWVLSYPTIIEGLHVIGFTNRYDGQDVGGKSDSTSQFFLDNTGSITTETNFIRYCWSEHSSGNGAGAVVSDNATVNASGLCDISFNYFDTIGSDCISAIAPGARVHHNWIGEREGHPDQGCNDTFFGGPIHDVTIDHNVIVPGDNDLFSFLYDTIDTTNFLFYCNLLRPPAVLVQSSCGNAGFEQASDSVSGTYLHVRSNFWFANNTLVGGLTHYPASLINLKTRDNPGPYGFAIDDNAWHIVNQLIVRNATSAAAAALAPFGLASYDSSSGFQTNSSGYGWLYNTNGIEFDYNQFVDYFGGNLRIGNWGSATNGIFSLTNATDVANVIGFTHNQTLTNGAFLIDPAAFDFAPATSLVQMGTNLTALESLMPDITLDIYGTTRPASGAWSAGAIEYQGLVAWWDFRTNDNWTTTGVLTDWSGHTNHGYKYASAGRQTWPTLTNGPGGLMAARFTNNLVSGFHYGTYIVVPLTNAANQSLWTFTNGTWALWAEVDLDYAQSYSGDEQFLTTGQDTNNWFFGSYYSTASTSGPQFSRASTTGGQEPMDTFSRWPNVTASDWHHYAITWDGSTVQAYYDGQLWNHGDGRTYTNANTFNYTTNFTGLLVSTNSVGLASSWIALGVNTHSGTPDPDDVDGLPNNGQLQGALADVRIYNRALSAAEIGVIYSATNGAGSNPTPPASPSARVFRAQSARFNTIHIVPP